MKMRKLSIALILCMVVAMLSACGGNGGEDTFADKVILGVIYTAGGEQDIVSAVAIKDGEFVYTGDEDGVQEYIGENTEVIELGDGMAVPGFMEAHAHGHSGGVGYLYEVSLYEGESLEDYQQSIRDFMEANPDMEFINGGGWINGYFPTTGPTAAMLDEISTEVPIVMVSGDHHSYWVNSKALEVAGVDADTPDIYGGVIERDKDGNPTGTFRELANSLVEDIIPKYTVEQYKEGILAYQEEAKSYGITAYFEPMVNLDGSLNLLQAYNELEEAGELEIRTFGGYQIVAEGNPLEELDKCLDLVNQSKGGDFEVNSIKLLVDGVIEGRTAYLLEDYSDQAGYKGDALWTQEDLNQVCAKADEMGIIVHTHAIGDAAVKMAVDAYEYTAEQNGTTANRHAITHLQVVAPDDIQRMADLEVIACTNPYWFMKEPGYFYELEVPYLGERADKEYPMKSFFDAGVVVTSASDYPVTMPAEPLCAIQTGVIRCYADDPENTLQNPEERVTVEQMLQASTINGAYANFAEETFGSIEVGKSADLIILDKNILEIDPLEIETTSVKSTILKGEEIYTAE